MQPSESKCDLCQQPAVLKGFEVMTTQGLKTFCCEGCRSIFQMLYVEQILPISEEKEI